MHTKRLIKLCLILILLIGLSACRSTEPLYKVYVLRASEEKLKAHDEKDDLPISVCDTKGACYVLLRDEYAKAMKDTAELRLRLDACEKRTP